MNLMSKTIDNIKDNLDAFYEYLILYGNIEDAFKFAEVRRRVNSNLDKPLVKVVFDTIEQVPNYQDKEWCGTYRPEYDKVEFKHTK
jgi:hypothetical protein